MPGIAELLDDTFEGLVKAGAVPLTPPGKPINSEFDVRMRKDDIMDVMQLVFKGHENAVMNPEMHKALIMTMCQIAHLPKDQLTQFKELLTGANPNPENAEELQKTLQETFKMLFKNILTSLNNSLPPEQRLSEEKLDAKAEELAMKFVSQLMDPTISAERKMQSMATIVDTLVNEFQKSVAEQKQTQGQAGPRPQLPAEMAAGAAELYIDKGFDPSVVLAKTTIIDTTAQANQVLQEKNLEAAKDFGVMTAELIALLITHNLLEHKSSVAYKPTPK